MSKMAAMLVLLRSDSYSDGVLISFTGSFETDGRLHSCSVHYSCSLQSMGGPEYVNHVMAIYPALVKAFY